LALTLLMSEHGEVKFQRKMNIKSISNLLSKFKRKPKLEDDSIEVRRIQLEEWTLRIQLEQFERIPTTFDPYEPKREGGGYTKELGCYQWFLYQYKIVDSKQLKDFISMLKSNDIQKKIELHGKVKISENKFYELEKYYIILPTNIFAMMEEIKFALVDHKQPSKDSLMEILPSTTFTKFLNYSEVEKLLLLNYQGWAPYAEVKMDLNRAKELIDKLIKAFLHCHPSEAVYIDFSASAERDAYRKGFEPCLISARIGITDTKNYEFFELVLGGTD